MADEPINISKEELEQQVAKSKENFAEIYRIKKEEYYKNGGRGRFSLKTKEDIKAERDAFMQRIKNKNKAKSDFSAISDEQYRQLFIQLVSDYKKQQTLYKNVKHNAIINKYEAKPVYCTCWLNWLTNIKQTYNYTLKEEYIVYNDEHYAVWKEDPIYLLDDYKVHSTGGHLTRHFTAGKAHAALKRYCKLFFNMLPNEPFELYLWSIMEFIRQTVEINNYIIKPEDVYQEAAKVYYTKSRKEKKAAPKLHKRRHKILYLEPGFEAEGKAAYIIYKKHKEEDCIINYLRYDVKDGEIDVKDLVMALGYYKMDHMENIEAIENQWGVATRGLACLKVKNERKIRYLVNKIIKEHEEFSGIKFKRKSQDKTSWHNLVKEGKTYKEVINEYPDVTYNNYKVYKYRLNKDV